MSVALFSLTESSISPTLQGDVLKIGFGDPASNDAVVKEVTQTVHALRDRVHGKVLKINGAASLPVATVLAHKLSHVVAALAVYDPKIGKYVVTVAHGGTVAVGDLIN